MKNLEETVAFTLNKRKSGPSPVDLTGQRFGRLLVVGRAPNMGEYTAHECRCDCGTTKNIRSNALKSGGSKSCGCLKVDKFVDRATKHGQSRTAEYRAWSAMKSRCYDASNKYYHRYGGRGITVCSEWRDSFETFLCDMGPRPSGHSLERKENDIGYSASNCKWATPLEQAGNTSRNRILHVNGEDAHVSDWARKQGVTSGLIFGRLALGWSDEDAVLTPVRKRS